MLIRSVDPGPDGDIGLLPGDRILSFRDDVQFMELLDGNQFYSPDSVLIFARDSSEIKVKIDEDIIEDLGITSQFGHNLTQPSIWLKVTTQSKITEDRAYLMEFMYYDSVLLYQTDESGNFTEKKTGTRIPASEKDYIISDFTAIQVVLNNDQQQTFYINILDSDDHPFPPYFYLTPIDHVMNLPAASSGVSY